MSRLKRSTYDNFQANSDTCPDRRGCYFPRTRWCHSTSPGRTGNRWDKLKKYSQEKFIHFFCIKKTEDQKKKFGRKRQQTVRGRSKMTSASDIRLDLSPPPYLSATGPKWSHTVRLKPRPPILGPRLFPTPFPLSPLADVIFGWPLR